MENSIVRFRDQEIRSVIVDDNEMIPIKPICEALDLHYPTQFDQIKKDEILGQLFCLARTTGADGKSYQMACLPLKFLFGWLFSIGGQANENFKLYKLECYNVLYDHFIGRAKFELEKSNEILRLENNLSKMRSDHKSIESDLKRKISQIEDISYDDFLIDKRQLRLFDDNENTSS